MNMCLYTHIVAFHVKPSAIAGWIPPIAMTLKLLRTHRRRETVYHKGKSTQNCHRFALFHPPQNWVPFDDPVVQIRILCFHNGYVSRVIGMHEVWVGNIMTPVNLRDSQWEAVLWLAVWFRLNLHQWSFSNMSGAVLWNSCFRGTRSFLKPGAIGILRVWSLRRSGDFQGEKSSWCYRSKYRHHTPTIVVTACSVSGEHAIDNFTKMLYQPAQCYIWFLSVSYLKDTFAGSQAPSSTPYQPLGTDGHMTWWDPTWNGMGHYGTPWPWPGAGWFDSGIWECQQSRDKHGFLFDIFGMGSWGNLPGPGSMVYSWSCW